IRLLFDRQHQQFGQPSFRVAGRAVDVLNQSEGPALCRTLSPSGPTEVKNPMKRNLLISHRGWLFLVLGAGCVVTGLVMAADTAADVPAKDPGFYLHHFEYTPPDGAKPQKAAVGGEFNNWSETEFPLKPDGAGHWTADVKLAEGPHAYRFFVDGAWVNDSDQHSEADLEES